MVATKRDTVMMTDNDSLAADHVKDRNILGSRAGAIRFSATMQRRRDAETRSPEADLVYRKRYGKLRESCVDMLQKGREFGRDENSLHTWVFWRKQETLIDLEVVQSFWRFAKRAEAIRFVIRVQAVIDGFEPVGGW